MGEGGGGREEGGREGGSETEGGREGGGEGVLYNYMRRHEDEGGWTEDER